LVEKRVEGLVIGDDPFLIRTYLKIA
jgi:hypothetical protein